jgi:glycosyltransferase involved in cell wall biosynthesis
METINEPVFAPPSTKEARPYGVTWNGLWSAEGLSFGQVGRRMIRAIEQAGMPVSAVMDEMGVMSTTLCNDYAPTVLAEMGCSLNEEAMERRRVRCEMSGDKDPETPIYHLDGAMNVSLNHILADIHHVLPKHDVLRSILFPQSARFVPRAEMAALHRYKVLFTALEADRLAEVDAIEVRKFGQVWVPCGANKQALVKSGVDESKVHVVPHPMPLERIAELRAAKASVGRRPVTDPNRPYIFYSIGKWEPRKNHPLLIESFLSEFKPTEGAVLMLKTSSFGEWDNFPKTPTDAIREALSKPAVVANGWNGDNIRKKVIVNTSLLSEAEMLRLHGTGDCYVTATHGEGWDMPLYDAMVAGSAIVTTDHGGAQEYLANDDFRLDRSIAVVPGIEVVNGTSEVAHRGYGWGHARWGKVEGHDVQQAMRRAFKWKLLPAPGRFHAPCYPSAVGKLCRRLILDLCDMTEEKLHGLRLQARQPRTDPQGHGRPIQGRWRRRLRRLLALGRDAAPLAPR